MVDHMLTFEISKYRKVHRLIIFKRKSDGVRNFVILYMYQYHQKKNYSSVLDGRFAH